MKKIFKKILFGLLALFLVVAGYLFIGSTKPAENITWGVNFSQKQAELLGLDWQETYSALLEDLGVKNIKLASQWDFIERAEGEYNFEDLDWQIKKAEENGVKILLIIGMKTSRWPECHIPEWAKSLSKETQQKSILRLLQNIVPRYRDSKAIWAWQVENEPFFPFGECPWVDKKFLKKEIDLVKSLDTQHRPVVITDTGEGSLWITASNLGDIPGTTMYKKVWFSAPYFLKKYLGPFKDFGFYLQYPLPPTFYGRKANIIEKFFGKEVIGIELQAEPWGPTLLVDSPIEEQEKTMNLAQFKYNIDFAKKTGLDTHYLWGAEWWYWMKEKQNQPEIWQEAKKLFQ